MVTMLPAATEIEVVESETVNVSVVSSVGSDELQPLSVMLLSRSRIVTRKENSKDVIKVKISSRKAQHKSLMLTARLLLSLV